MNALFSDTKDAVAFTFEKRTSKAVPVKIVSAYILDRSNPQYGSLTKELNLEVLTDEGKELKLNRMWTHGKNGKPFTEKNGKKFLQEGANVIREFKVLGLLDTDLEDLRLVKKHVEVFGSTRDAYYIPDLDGKKVIMCLEAYDENGNDGKVYTKYRLNLLADKESKLTPAEIEAKITEPKQVALWLEKNEGKTTPAPKEDHKTSSVNKAASVSTDGLF